MSEQTDRRETIRKRLATLLALVTVALAVTAACAPVAPPPTAPVSRSSATTPAVAPVPAQPRPTEVTAEQSAWARVVEAGRKEGAVTAYNYQWVGDRGIAISRAFRQRYGIELQIVTGRGAEFLERLKVEKRVGKVMADVFEGSAVHTRNVMEDGLTASLAELPILQNKTGWNIQPQVFDPTANMVMHLPWTMVPYVNTNLVKPADMPRTWDDLTHPRWKGKIATADPNLSNLSYYWLLLLRQKAVSEDFIQRMAQQDLGYVKGAPDLGSVLARGEYAIGANSSDSTMAEVAHAGAPIKAVEVEKGTLVSGLTVARLKDGPHPNAAKVFLNWLLSDEGQRVQAEVSGTFPLRQAVPDFRHPVTRVRLVQPINIGVEENQEIAQAFRDKVMVNHLRKGR